METDFFFIALSGWTLYVLVPSIMIGIMLMCAVGAYIGLKIMQLFRFMFGSGGGLVEVEAGHGGS